VILLDLMNTPWLEHEYLTNRIIKVLNPLETDEGIYLYLLTTTGELYPVRPHGTGQAAAIEQGSISDSGGQEKPDDEPWTKQIRPLLLDAIGKVHGFNYEDYPIRHQALISSTEAWRAPLTFRRLSELQDDFSAVRGPKTLIWVTSGVLTNVSSSCDNNVISSAMGTYASGTCGEVCQIPAGAWTVPGTCMDYTPFLEHYSAQAAAVDTTVDSLALTATGLQDSDLTKRANTLAKLADLTGGKVYLNTDGDFEKAIREAVAARTARYQLAFAPSVQDGKYHKVRVVCTRAGVHIQGPTGYFAGKP
jgi:VWFA-related protein